MDGMAPRFVTAVKVSPKKGSPMILTSPINSGVMLSYKALSIAPYAFSLTRGHQSVERRQVVGTVQEVVFYRKAETGWIVFAGLHHLLGQGRIHQRDGA